MASFLKPNKIKMVGTALLIAVTWIGNLISRFATQFFMQLNRGDDAAQAGTTGSFAGYGFGPGGNLGMQSGLFSDAVDFIVMALLFYIVLCFVLEKSAENPETRKQNKK